MQMSRFWAYLISCQNGLIFFVLCFYCYRWIFNRWRRRKSIWVMQRVHRVINMDHFTIGMIAARARPGVA